MRSYILLSTSLAKLCKVWRLNSPDSLNSICSHWASAPTIHVLSCLFLRWKPISMWPVCLILQLYNKGFILCLYFTKSLLFFEMKKHYERPHPQGMRSDQSLGLDKSRGEAALICVGRDEKKRKFFYNLMYFNFYWVHIFYFLCLIPVLQEALQRHLFYWAATVALFQERNAIQWSNHISELRRKNLIGQKKKKKQ